MPRRSPFLIRLTEEERAELEARCKEYASPYRDVVRAKIILLASEGLGNDRIAARLDMPRQIASKWRQRFCTDRLPGLDDRPRGGRPARFSPNVVVAIKALACELPSRRGLPLARWSVAELRHEAVASGIVAQISGTTLWRWLGQDALRPWRHRSWIFPRDLTSPARLAGSSICTSAAGKAQRWGGAITCSASMRRPAFRRGGAHIGRCPQRRGVQSMLSMNTCVPAPWPTSPRGMCIEPGCSAAVSARTA